MKSFFQPVLSFSANLFGGAASGQVDQCQSMISRASLGEISTWVSKMNGAAPPQHLSQNQVSSLVAWAIKKKNLSPAIRKALTHLPNFNIHALEPDSGQSLLSISVQEHDSEFFRHLLLQGADPKSIDRTVLAGLGASEQQDIEMVGRIRQLGIDTGGRFLHSPLENALLNYDTNAVRKLLGASTGSEIDQDNFFSELSRANFYRRRDISSALLVTAPPDWIEDLDPDRQDLVEEQMRALSVMNRLQLNFLGGQASHALEKAMVVADVPAMRLLLQKFMGRPLSHSSIVAQWERAKTHQRHDMACAILALARPEWIDLLHRTVNRRGISTLHQFPLSDTYTGLDRYLKQYSHYTKNKDHNTLVNINGSARFFASSQQRFGLSDPSVLQLTDRVMCRSIAVLRAMEHLRQARVQKNAYLAAGKRPAEETGILVPKHPFDYKKFSSVDDLSKNISLPMDHAYRLIKAVSREVHNDLDHANWGEIVYDQFHRMAAQPWEEGVPKERTRVMLLHTPNHLLTVVFKMSEDASGKICYKLKFDDPNVTIPSKRAETTDLESVRNWTFSSMFLSTSTSSAADRVKRYFPSSQKFSLFLCPEELADGPRALYKLISVDYLLAADFGKDPARFREEFDAHVGSLSGIKLAALLRPGYSTRAIIPDVMKKVQEFPAAEAHVRKFIRDVCRLATSDRIKAELMVGGGRVHSIFQNALTLKLPLVSETIRAEFRKLKLTAEETKNLFTQKDGFGSSLLHSIALHEDGNLEAVLDLMDQLQVPSNTQHGWLFNDAYNDFRSIFSAAAVEGMSKNISVMLDRFLLLPDAGGAASIPGLMRLVGDLPALENTIVQFIDDVGKRDIPDRLKADMLVSYGSTGSILHAALENKLTLVTEKIATVLKRLTLSEQERHSLFSQPAGAAAAPAYSIGLFQNAGLGVAFGLMEALAIPLAQQRQWLFGDRYGNGEAIWMMALENAPAGNLTGILERFELPVNAESAARMYLLLDKVRANPAVEAYIARFIGGVAGLAVPAAERLDMLVGADDRQGLLQACIEHRLGSLFDLSCNALGKIPLTEEEKNKLFSAPDRWGDSLLHKVAAGNDGYLERILALMDDMGIPSRLQQKWLFDDVDHTGHTVLVSSIRHRSEQNALALLARFDALPAQKKLALFESGNEKTGLMFNAVRSMKRKLIDGLLARLSQLGLSGGETARLLQQGHRSAMQNAVRFDDVEAIEHLGDYVRRLDISEQGKLDLLLDTAAVRKPGDDQSMLQMMLLHKAGNAIDMMCRNIGALRLPDWQKTAPFLEHLPGHDMPVLCHGLKEGDETVIERMQGLQSLAISDESLATILAARDAGGTPGVVLALREGHGEMVRQYREMVAPYAGQEEIGRVLEELALAERQAAIQQAAPPP